jgi:hypothetical protein
LSPPKARAVSDGHFAAKHTRRGNAHSHESRSLYLRRTPISAAIPPRRSDCDGAKRTVDPNTCRGPPPIRGTRRCGQLPSREREKVSQPLAGLVEHKCASAPGRCGEGVAHVRCPTSNARGPIPGPRNASNSGREQRISRTAFSHTPCQAAPIPRCRPPPSGPARSSAIPARKSAMRTAQTVPGIRATAASARARRRGVGVDHRLPCTCFNQLAPRQQRPQALAVRRDGSGVVLRAQPTLKLA